MATERDLELLDDYLANRLQGNERKAFEEKLKSDPDLNAEFQFQQRLIKGIVNVRKAELKSILQNTPVPPVNYGTSALGKFAIGTVVAGLVVTGVYLYHENTETNGIGRETEAIADSSTTQDDSVATDSQSNEASDSNPIAQTAPDSSTENTTTSSKPAEKAPPSAPAKKKKQKSQQPAEQPVIDVYEPTEESEEDLNGDTEEPAGERRTPIKAGAPSIAVEIDRDHKKYDFHYQFKAGKLFLYGPFERNLYEILEFFSEDKRTVFLYYKDGYYLLEENNEKVKSLKSIQDENLIQKLKNYRQN